MCVKTPAEYLCVILPSAEAERAAQLNLDHSYRNLKNDGSTKKPGKVCVLIGYIPKPKDASRLPLLEAEQAIISKYVSKWDLGAC